MKIEKMSFDEYVEIGNLLKDIRNNLFKIGEIQRGKFFKKESMDKQLYKIVDKLDIFRSDYENKMFRDYRKLPNTALDIFYRCSKKITDEEIKYCKEKLNE